MTLPVFIEARDVPIEARDEATLLTGCSSALREPCVVGRKATRGNARRALIVVHGKDAERIAIWVYEGGAIPSYRELRFDRQDAVAERWRAAGLVAASFALAPVPDASAPPAPEAVGPPEAATSAATQAEPVRRLPWSAVAGLSTGPWAKDAPWMIGIGLGFEAQPFAAPVGIYLGVDLGRTWGSMPSSASVAQQGVAIGLFALLPDRGRLRLRFQGQIARERLAVSASDASGATDFGSSFRTAGSLGVGPTLYLSRSVSLHANVRATLHDGAPGIFVGDRTIARASRVTASGFAGIGLQF